MKKSKGILLFGIIIGLNQIIFAIFGCASNLQSKINEPDTVKRKIRAGDVIEIKFDCHPDFDQIILVQPNGNATLRALGEMKISNLTPKAFESLLNQNYRRWLFEPNIKVSVKNSSKFNIYIGGEVHRPGMVSFKGKLTVAQGILLAGGLKNKTVDFEVLIFRNQGWEGVKRYKIKLKEKTSKNKLNRNFELAPYDVVFVLKSAKVDSRDRKLI